MATQPHLYNYPAPPLNIICTSALSASLGIYAVIEIVSKYTRFKPSLLISSLADIFDAEHAACPTKL